MTDTREALQKNDAVWAAFYRDGKSLIEIATEFGCSPYDLSPWLGAPLLHGSPDEKRVSKIKQAHAIWSDATFGYISAIGPARHLAKEAQEVVDNPRDITEYVDCQFLIWDMIRRAGWTADEFATAAEAKMEVLKQRKWGKIVDGQAVEHIRDAG